MKAVVIDQYGGADEVSVQDLPDPEPGPGEVVIRVAAAALNRLDLWTLSGSLGFPIDFPHVLGADAAGEIDGLGEGVNGLRRGARVMVNPGLSCGECELCRAGEQSECPDFKLLGEHVPGTFAEKIKVPVQNVFPFPSHLSWAEAASLGITFTTAYRMLFSQGHFRPGEWALITGIGGGLALSLLQLARPVAGRIFVTSSSPDKLARAGDLGADEGIDYTAEDVGKAVRRLTGKRGVDAVFDSAGGASLDANLRSVRPGGRVVIAGATGGPKAEIDLRRIFWSQLSIIGATMGSHRNVSDMLRAVAGGKLVPKVDRTFPFESASEAFSYLESQDRFGKVVLEFGSGG
ncbi:MAG: zinc-binding dehydrogenase [Actinomycetota bacterium]|nr:zinc-binding dehydrogenase [Actinomycetota bacterium]